ncbi:MAG: sulfotransferase [Bacillota bacterium]
MGAEFKQAVEAFQAGDLGRARAMAEAELAGTGSAEAHHLLGLVHCRAGDPGAGIDHLRAAADAEPGNAAYRVMLMRALVDAGRAAEVLDMPEPPAIGSRGELELWRARAEAADAAEDRIRGIGAWAKVAAATPNDWRAWANLGHVLAAECRWSEAIDALGNAARLNPSESALHWSLGAALAEADRHEEALVEVARFEELAGPTDNSSIARARCLLAVGRFEEAEQAYRAALKLAPDNPDVFRELGRLFERTNRLDLLSDLLGEAKAAGVPERDLIHLHVLHTFREGRFEEAHALLADCPDPEDDPLGWERIKGKIADRLGRPDEAFAAAEAMNRLTPGFDAWRERAAKHRQRMRDLARSLTGIAELPQLDRPERRMPAFLVGFPRSGTTLLDTFLMGHPDTAVLEEVHLLGAAERQIGKVAELGRVSREALERARDAYFAEQDLYVDKAFSGLVVDKLPLNLVGAPFIEALFPGAPIIFAQRHPCDAVLSGFMQAFRMNDAMASFLTIEDAADLYDAVMSGWRAILERFRLNVHTVRYERLVEDAEAELRPLVEFLGLPWSDRMLAHTETAKARGTIITPSYDQVTEPLTSRSVGRWKKYEKKLAPVLPVLLPWAEWLGYED